MVTESQTIEGYALSAQQERLWLQDGAKSACSAQCLTLFEGTLDAEVLERALALVLDRNEILRTRFGCLEGMEIPLQIIASEAALPISEVDLSALSQEDQQAEVDALYQRLQNAPLFQGERIALSASLIRLAPERHLLLLRLPALCADGAGLRNLMGEISRCYEHCARETPLPEPGIQYVDYAQWQQEVSGAENADAGLKFWQQKGLPDSSGELPFQHPKKDDAIGFAPASVRIELDNAALKSLQSEMQGGASLRDLLFSAWLVLLWRLAGPESPAVAVACDGRKYPELQSGIGLYERYLPLSLPLSSSLPLGEVVKEARAAITDAYRFQDYFSWKAMSANPDARASFVPFAFDYQETGADEVYAGLRTSLSRYSVTSDRFLVRLSCIERSEGLSAEIHYDSAALSEADARRMGALLQSLLASAAENPSAGIGALNLLNSEERHRLLVTLNETRAEFPQDRCVHQLFEEQAARTPDALAVAYEDKRLTYDELNRRANQLARYLRGQGVGPDVLVGLCVERSLEMMVGLLGILKAGGAYVPLDPSYPPERLQFMLEDSGAKLLLTQERLRTGLPEHSGRLVCLDSDWSEISEEETANLEGGAGPDNLVYVIYTSGSTGRPKGAMLVHRGLTNYLSWAAQEYRVAEGQGAPVYSAIGFDLTVTGLYSPLLVGRSVTLIPQETGIEALGPALCTGGDYSLVKITPAHLELLSQQMPDGQAVDRTRAFIIGGEALLGESLAFWREHAPQTRIVNEYGPTETVVGCCVYSLLAGEAQSGPVPIGRPIANTELYLLDREGNPSPMGVPGELCIGGAGLARGYLHRPDLTAEKFVPHPFSPEPGARLYRTGDICRYLPDGNLEFLGRVDHQVKIRGYRIELGEIESVLLGHPGVREALVLAREDAPGEKRLVAYLSVDARVAPSLSELRDCLKAALPEYMVPSAFVFLDALPLTVNGKVDRKALPAPDGSRPQVESVYQAPQTPAEETLCRIWSEVLRLERVGVNDNFFELGGDSILSIHIIARANHAGLHLTPRQVFQHQTVAALAAMAGTGPRLVSEQGVIEGPVPLTPIQRWFLEQDWEEPHHFNQARLLELHPSVGLPMAAKAVEALVAHHDALRLRFIRTDAGWEQANAGREMGEVFTRIDLSEVDEEEQGAAITAACARLQASLNLKTGPLLRVTYFDMGPAADARLFMTVHHLALDGISWQILLEDLQSSLEQLGRGERVALPPKTTSFQYWAVRLTDYAQSEDLNAEGDYWTSAIDKSLPALPQDINSGVNLVSTQQAFRASLGVEETRALLQDVPSVYNTQINDVLLTGLAQAFREWTGERSLLVDLEGHGREALFEDVDVSRTVGWFTSVFPVQVDLPAGGDAGEALKGVKEMLRSVPNHGIGYGLLRYLSPDETVRRSLAALPAAQVCFNYHGQMSQAGQDSGLFSPAAESAGQPYSPQGKWFHLLDINCLVRDDCLQVVWLYNDQVYARSTVERLAEGYLAALRGLIAHCRSAEAGGYTPSDFPKAKVSQQALDRLLGGLGKR